MATLRELRFARLNRILQEQAERTKRDRKAREEGKRKKRSKKQRIVYAENLAAAKEASKKRWHEVRARNKQLKEQKKLEAERSVFLKALGIKTEEEKALAAKLLPIIPATLCSTLVQHGFLDAPKLEQAIQCLISSSALYAQAKQ